jgi:Caspase domain/Domain of unknown function (DUF4384)
MSFKEKILKALFFGFTGALSAVSMNSVVFGTPVLRTANLLQDKVPTAAILASVSADVDVKVISIEGGWALVEYRGISGWLRASNLKIDVSSNSLSGLQTGRQATGSVINTALSLGVRGLPSRNNRHALIINISEYGLSKVTSLPGTKHDSESATQMALAMQIPQNNIVYLKDSAASGFGIRRAISDLNQKISKGDRVFIYYSGHGTRYFDPEINGCIEAMLPYDATFTGMVSNRELATLLKPITDKADKVMLMYDACHSGGLIGQGMKPPLTRSFTTPQDEGQLTGKFSPSSEFCAAPSNIKTRSLTTEQSKLGVFSQDIIHISASRDNEVSFEDADKGGLATQFMRDCMLRDAKDLDRSGAISISEITKCAQSKIENRLGGVVGLSPHHIQVNGNAEFVPAWFSQATITASQPNSSLPNTDTEQFSGTKALSQLFEQRDAKHQVQVEAAKTKLKIGVDKLDFSITSSLGGYVYVLLAASDNKSTYLLYPNELDLDNKIEPAKPLKLPREKWQIVAGGPEGQNSILVIVASSERDISKLAQAAKVGPFMKSINDLPGRVAIGSVFSSGVLSDKCSAAENANTHCSDAYGAQLLTIDEVR